MVGHAQSSLCSGGCPSRCHSPLLCCPQWPSYRARVEEEIRRVCEHMCSETVQSGVVTSPLSLSVSLCTHTQWKQLPQRERRKVGKCPHSVSLVPGV